MENSCYEYLVEWSDQENFGPTAESMEEKIAIANDNDRTWGPDGKKHEIYSYENLVGGKPGWWQPPRARVMARVICDITCCVGGCRLRSMALWKQCQVSRRSASATLLGERLSVLSWPAAGKEKNANARRQPRKLSSKWLKWLG